MNNMNLIGKAVGVLILIHLITGCGSHQIAYNKGNIKGMSAENDNFIDDQRINLQEQKKLEQQEKEQTNTEQHETDLVEKTEGIYKGNLNVPIDYDFLEENYGVYIENICTDPKLIYENPVILDLIKLDLDYEKEISRKIPEITITDHDYFIFDFNGDGLDDYLVCFHGFGYSGSGGNSIRMYVQEKDGGFTLRLRVTAKIYLDDPHEHEAIAVLDKHVEGFYSLVLPWTKNRVWSYSMESERYDSFQYADEEQ